MVSASDTIVKALFRERVEQVKKDIATGKIKFYNSPPVWTEKLLNLTALNWILVDLVQQSGWN